MIDDARAINLQLATTSSLRIVNELENDNVNVRFEGNK